MSKHFNYRTPAQRLAKHTRREGECLLWTGEIYTNGYGRMRMADRSSLSAHRVAYELANGPIPEGMFVCHTCDVRNCVEPTHLWLGTHTDNMHDKIRKGKHNTAKLTPLQVEQLRVLFAAGYKNRDVAPYYPKVDRHTFAAIKKGRIWRSL